MVTERLATKSPKMKKSALNKSQKQLYRTLKDGGSNFQNKFDANDDVDFSRDEDYHKTLQNKGNDDLQNSAKKLRTIESTASKNPEIE